MAPPNLIGVKTREFTIPERTLFMQLSKLADMDHDPSTIEAESLKEIPIYGIIEHRLRAGNCKMSPLVKLWLVALSEGNPGRAVLWAWTCSHMQMAGDARDILVWTASFPYGIPTDEEYERIWDAQKLGGLNQLDDPAMWLPFHVKPASDGGQPQP